jgi:hypothetical protein
MFLGSKVRREGGADRLPPSMSRLSRQGGALNISQPYKPSRPVTWIVFFNNNISSILVHFRKKLTAKRLITKRERA